MCFIIQLIFQFTYSAEPSTYECYVPNSDILCAVWVRTFHQWQKIIKIQIFSVFPVQIFCIMFRMMLILNPRFFVAIISKIQMFHAPNIFSEFVDSTYDLLHQFLECQCLPSWSMVHVILNIESQQPTYMTNSIKLNMLDGTVEDRKVRFASVFCQYNLAFNFGYLPN